MITDKSVVIFTVSRRQLQRNFAKILSALRAGAVALHHQGRAEAYLVSADHYEHLLTCIEDLEDADLVRQRACGPFLDVPFDEL